MNIHFLPLNEINLKLTWISIFFYLQDVEMNIEELEGALQVVNHNLISESEFDYLYQVRVCQYQVCVCHYGEWYFLFQ